MTQTLEVRLVELNYSSHFVVLSGKLAKSESMTVAVTKKVMMAVMMMR
jgi:hypothetical protein